MAVNNHQSESDSEPKTTGAESIGVDTTIQVSKETPSVSTQDSTATKGGASTGNSESTPSPNTELAKYQQYALKLINEDRQKAGLTPVQLSVNEAAQRHAEDMLNTSYLSHWATDGMKPYMRYTVYNGLGAVGQNAAISGYDKSSIQECQIGLAYCSALDIEAEIKKSEYGMMYDDASSNWGHRDNILDKDHTHVSLGIASDKYTFAFIQNFETRFFTDEEKTNSGYDVRIHGKFIEPKKIEAKTINVYFDPSPTPLVYEHEKSRTSYDQGKFVGFVTPPLSPGFYYTGNDLTVAASNWKQDSSAVDISFNLQQFYQKEGPGVYTIYLLVGDSKDENSLKHSTSYSVFLQ